MVRPASSTGGEGTNDESLESAAQSWRSGESGFHKAENKGRGKSDGNGKQERRM
jgi:hypothetical protein